ncbi:uncharacterized protein LOC6557741 [Drosophila grimshawi]|uniref:GH16551 n=1 Tax=Drosophila grimshawi TaxID=7222 RepID=B4J1L7_DROGR|nr:uncharacterized protein LOC6557741 [Drosophila grimshawi]EDV96937.1 GH16551 [Drosophila grimshawi]
MDLLYMNVIQNLTLLPGSYVSQCIDQLNALYKLELNVYVAFGNKTLFESLIPARESELPTVRVTNTTLQLVMSGNYSERALTVIYLEDVHTSSMVDYLTTWLWRAQQLHVLIIYPEATTAKLFQLFTHCWRQGMVHILVVLPFTQKLFSYMPYPEVRLLKMENTLQYFHRTRDLLWDFHGYNITCGILISAPPTAFVFKNHRDRNIYAGYMLRMVLDFIHHFKGSIRTRRVDTLSEANQVLSTRDVDFLPYLLAKTPNFTNSVVLWLENRFLMAPSARLLPRYLYLVKPYTSYTWLVLLAMLMYCSGALFLLSRGRLNLSGAFLQIFRLSLFLPPGRDLVALPGPRRLFLYIMMTIAGLMLTNLYLAVLSSNLAAGIYDKQLNNFDDLEGTDYQLPEEEITLKFLLQLPDIHPQLAKRLVLTPEHLVERYRHELNTSMVYSALEDKIDFTFYQQKFLRVPLFRKLPKIIYQQPFFMPAAYGRPYLKIFNWYVRRMFEAGILLKMKNDGFGHGIQSGRLHFINRATLQEVNSNDLEYYYVAAVVWLGGMLLATACFGYECCMGSRMARQNRE